MTIDRRTPEAASLRHLFHSQWTHFLQLFNAWNARHLTKEKQKAALTQAIETVVDSTDVRLRGLGNYKNKLRHGVRALLHHVEELVASLPGSVAVNQKSFGKNPLLNALFVNKEEMKKIFSRSRELQHYFSSGQSKKVDEAFALLFVRKEEKTVLGKHLNGDILFSDVKQTIVNFTEHLVVSPGASEEATRNSLKKMLFARIVEYVEIHMTRLRYRQAEDSQTAKPSVNLKNPAIYLETLSGILNEPEELVKLQQQFLRLNKMGVKLTEESVAAENRLHLYELIIGKQPPQVVCLVSYPRNEMIPADKLLQEISRGL